MKNFKTKLSKKYKTTHKIITRYPFPWKINDKYANKFLKLRSCLAKAALHMMLIIWMIKILLIQIVLLPSSNSAFIFIYLIWHVVILIVDTSKSLCWFSELQWRFIIFICVLWILTVVGWYLITTGLSIGSSTACPSQIVKTCICWIIEVVRRCCGREGRNLLNNKKKKNNWLK